jgi:hypothetical protein
MPQDGKDEIEIVGVQAGHEAADIFERLAKYESLDESQKCRALPRTPHPSIAL